MAGFIIATKAFSRLVGVMTLLDQIMVNLPSVSYITKLGSLILLYS